MELTTQKAKKTDDNGSAYLIPENTLVPAIVAGIESDDFKWEGKTIEQIKWTFIFRTNDKWNGKEIFGNTTKNFVAHPNCKAYKYATAIAQREYKQDETLQTDDLLGLPCTIQIGHKDDKEGRTWMRVIDVFPANMTQMEPANSHSKGEDFWKLGEGEAPF